MRMMTQKLFRSRGTVNNQNRNVPKLDLVHISICRCPRSKLLGSIHRNVGEAADDGSVWRSIKIMVSNLVSNEFVEDEV